MQRAQQGPLTLQNGGKGSTLRSSVQMQTQLFGFAISNLALELIASAIILWAAVATLINIIVCVAYCCKGSDGKGKRHRSRARRERISSRNGGRDHATHIGILSQDDDIVESDSEAQSEAQ